MDSPEAPRELASALTTREAVKKNLLTPEIVKQNVDLIFQGFSLFMAQRANGQGRISKAELSGKHERVSSAEKSRRPTIGSIVQGTFERRLGQAKTSEQRRKVGRFFKTDFLRAFGDSSDEGANYGTPMDVVHAMANLENAIYDRSRADILAERGFSSKYDIPESERQAIYQQTLSMVDRTVRSIAANYMLGMLFGSEKLKQRAVSRIEVFLSPPEEKV